MAKRMTDEERVAKRMSDLISDLRLDLEMISLYITQLSPNVTINRILLMADIIKDEKEAKHNDYI